MWTHKLVDILIKYLEGFVCGLSGWVRKGFNLMFFILSRKKKKERSPKLPWFPAESHKPSKSSEWVVITKNCLHFLCNFIIAFYTMIHIFHLWLYQLSVNDCIYHISNHICIVIMYFLFFPVVQCIFFLFLKRAKQKSGE